MPGGTFLRFHDVGSRNNPAYPATVSSFYLDAFEVSVGRFRAFVEAYAGRPSAGSGASRHAPASGWRDSWPIAPDASALREALASEDCVAGKHRTWTDAPGTNERLPINCVTWYELFAFCAWDGGRLPTFAERNYAASGGDEQRVYPWSVPPGATRVDPSRALYAFDILHPPAPEPVGLRPLGRGRWGHFDLAGGVYEYVMDSTADFPRPCNDCVQLSGPTDPPSGRWAFGGAFRYGTDRIFSVGFDGFEASRRDSAVGARCARDIAN